MTPKIAAPARGARPRWSQPNAAEPAIGATLRCLRLAVAVALSLPLTGCMMAMMMPAMQYAVAGKAEAIYTVNRPPQTVYDAAVAALAASGRVELADPLRRGATGYDADGRFRIAFNVRGGATLESSEIAVKVEAVAGMASAGYGAASERLQAFVSHLSLYAGEPLVPVVSR